MEYIQAHDKILFDLLAGYCINYYYIHLIIITIIFLSLFSLAYARTLTLTRTLFRSSSNALLRSSSNALFFSFSSSSLSRFVMIRYDTPEIALSAGIMLRECIRHESLAKIILRSDKFDSLFRYVELSTFDIASDAYATFKDLLTKHKTMCAEYLDENYDKVIRMITRRVLTALVVIPACAVL